LCAKARDLFSLGREAIIQMINPFHGIVIDISQIDQSVFSSLKIIGKHFSSKMNWTLYKIESNYEELQSLFKKLQANIVASKYYFHFYNGEILIVVFIDKIFHLSKDKSSWGKAIEHGCKLGIPTQQLDFFPNRFEDEKY
jgi:hypothetical protein